MAGAAPTICLARPCVDGVVTTTRGAATQDGGTNGNGNGNGARAACRVPHAREAGGPVRVAEASSVRI
jgi:hypothetical protein